MTERTVIESISQTNVLSVQAQASAYEAACLMTKIVAKRRDPDATPVSDIMTHNPHFVAPETTVSDAVLIMQRHNFRHLPIISSTSKILGVFSIRDAMARELIEAETMADLIDEQFTNVLS